MVYGQENAKSISAKKTSEKLKIDGDLSDSTWLNSEVVGNFWQNFPFDSSLAKTKTEVMITYNEQFLYIAAICYDSMPGKYVVQTLKRDFTYANSDAFVVSIDPYSDLQNGFSFGVNPFGVQLEGLLANGGGGGITTNWDNKWYSEVKRSQNKWVVEMAIPFKSLRYKNDLKQWRINFARHDLKRNENSTWIKVPRQFSISSLAFTGFLNFDETPKKTGGNISIIPYAIGRYTEDYQNSGKPIYTPNIGGDAKIVLGSSLNLDLTVNPDFSQVEVDRQITNLTRFSLFFPEQRQFFIENSDLFERFGFRQIRPFFSRQIGLNNGNVIPILAGARLSGKPGKKWRIGVMDIQTDKANFNNIQLYSQNYFVAAFQRNIFKRSNISAIFVNRQQFDTSGLSPTNFNRIAGLDYNISSADNKWFGKLFFHHSLSNKGNQNAFAHASWINYSTQNVNIEWNHEYVDKNYNAETGFVPRIIQTDNFGVVNKLSYWRLEPHVYFYIYPKNSIINKMGPIFYLDHYLNQKFENTDIYLLSGYDINFTSTAGLYIHHNYYYTRLLFPTDVTFTGRNDFLNSGNYYYQNLNLQYKTNQRKPLYSTITANYGSYFIGNKFTGTLDVSYRFQPYAIFSMNFTHNRIYMPYIDKEVEINLISPRVDFTFSKNLFLTTFWQYNSQAKNINFNGRLQWRFKPMSDLYIVYSDNYYNNDFSIKNRAIVLKFVYWFNV
ncbi:MAG: DUF5916 domain-containing protein [Bacteroidota bacterium]|nr:DUF5916 domain-containing protein [Bacteroidota bacterium]